MPFGHADVKSSLNVNQKCNSFWRNLERYVKLPALKYKRIKRHLDFVNHHEYNFGSIIVLGLKVAPEFEASIKRKEITILVRNYAPEIKCKEHGNWQHKTVVSASMAERAAL